MRVAAVGEMMLTRMSAVEHLLEIGRFHLAERFVAQNAGIGTQEVDAAPLLGGALNHRRDLLEIGDVGAVGHGDAARFTDLLDHGFRRRQRTAAAIARAAEIVDHDFGAAARQSQRMRAPQTIARAGDDGDASVEPDCHECSSCFFFLLPLWEKVV
jgi:hypothetical protein